MEKWQKQSNQTHIHANSITRIMLPTSKAYQQNQQPNASFLSKIGISYNYNTKINYNVMDSSHKELVFALLVRQNTTMVACIWRNILRGSDMQDFELQQPCWKRNYIPAHPSQKEEQLPWTWIWCLWWGLVVTSHGKSGITTTQWLLWNSAWNLYL